MNIFGKQQENLSKNLDDYFQHDPIPQMLSPINIEQINYLFQQAEIIENPNEPTEQYLNQKSPQAEKIENPETESLNQRQIPIAEKQQENLSDDLDDYFQLDRPIPLILSPINSEQRNNLFQQAEIIENPNEPNKQYPNQKSPQAEKSENPETEKFEIVISLEMSESLNQSQIPQVRIPQVRIPHWNKKCSQFQNETKNLYKGLHGYLQKHIKDLTMNFKLSSQTKKFLKSKSKDSGKLVLINYLKSCQQLKAIAKQFYGNFLWCKYLINNNKADLDKHLRLNQIILDSIDN